MVCLKRSYHFKLSKDCPPQSLLGPFLNALSHVCQKVNSSQTQYSIIKKCLNPFYLKVAVHIGPCHLICFANQTLQIKYDWFLYEIQSRAGMSLKLNETEER